jgi:hypothetical protein
MATSGRSRPRSRIGNAQPALPGRIAPTCIASSALRRNQPHLVLAPPMVELQRPAVKGRPDCERALRFDDRRDPGDVRASRLPSRPS